MQRIPATLLLVVVLLACGEKERSAASPGGDPAAGHALLGEYVSELQQLAKHGSVDLLEPFLADQLGKATELEKAGEVGDEFVRRHRRIIDVTRAVIAPQPGAAEKQKVIAFLDAVEGKKQRTLNGGLVEVAPALVEEVLSLHMLLDGTSDREAARTKYLPELGP
jgi:hypothetical protein